VLALSDDLVVDGTPVERAHLAPLPPGRSVLRLSTGHAAGRLLLLGGEPFDEELLMWWNFVARSHDEIVEAREEWTAAVAGAPTRFGQVSGYDGAALPAPAVPTSRLRPRRRT
jgi:quercetin 2,3-dioxygenase